MPQRPPLSTVIFDFDGVIADTERLHLHAFQDVFTARGWTLREEVYFDRYLGYDDEGLVAAFDADEGLAMTEIDREHLVAEKGRVFGAYLERGDVLFPDASACVLSLATHFTLGIASGALKNEIQRILAAAALTGQFKTIVSAEDVSVCKPDPEPYLTAARRLGVDPAACVAIEDSPPGLAAARSAGMRTVGITTTAPRHHLQADHVVDRLAEVTPDVLARLT